MNSVSLAQRLLRYLNVKDIGLLPADDALGVVDAINAAIQEYYTIVPSAYKGTTFSGTLLPAQNVTVTINYGSNTFTGWTATQAQKGFTIVIGPDQRQNTIVGPNQLLDIFMPTSQVSGTFTAQVYGDVLHMEQIIERFTEDPWLVDYNRVLQRDENWRRQGIRGVWPGAYQMFPYGTYGQRQVRIPWKYWIERQGESQGAYPPFMLRTDSLPDVEYRVRIEGLLAPQQITIQNLTIPVILDLDYFSIENTVLKIAIKNLISHQLWTNPKIIPAVMADYQVARDMAMSRAPDQGASTNYVGTPYGW